MTKTVSESAASPCGIFKLSGSALGLALALSLGLSACSPARLEALKTGTDKVSIRAAAGPDTASSKPFKAETEEEEEDCLPDQSGGRRLLPLTNAPLNGRILPATGNDCGFYNWAWHNFLYQTRPGKALPAFLESESFESVFGLASTEADQPLKLNAGFRQAGDLAAILVDHRHRPIYYSVHINKTFADFVRKHRLNQLEALLKQPGFGGAPRDLEFPAGSLELKAAWRVLDPDERGENFLTITARIPVLVNRGGEVVASGETRVARVALLSLHVVGVAQDHPEFIWATFEHADAGGHRDLAPAAHENPVEGQPQRLDLRSRNYPLFAADTPVGLANQPKRQLIDEASQTFPETTPVYRAFPASLGEQAEEDVGVATLNQHIGELFSKTDAAGSDLRRHYRLVGAVWLDQPGADQPDGVFKADRKFENAPDPDAEAVLAGEDSLSSLAMESFTQHPRVNCLSCHDTTAKIVAPNVYMPPRRINVSNALQFYARLKLAAN